MAQYKNYIIFGIVGLFGIMFVIMPDITLYFGWAVVLGGIFLILLFLIYVGMKIYLMITKEYWEKEKEKLQVITAPLGQQVYVKDDGGAHFHALHLEQRTYSNGQYAPPSSEESHAWEVFNQPKRGGLSAVPKEQQIKSANPPPNLLPLLENAWKIFLVGNEGSGKTTLLRALLAGRLQAGPALVVDIHGNKEYWPGAKVIGTGYNLDEVTLTFDRIIAEIKKRYGLISENPDAKLGFTPITLICDEFSSLVYNLKQEGYDISQFMRMMATEVRKTKVSFIFASHVDTLVGTGMDGAAKLLKSFVKVNLAYDQVRGEREYTVNLGDGQGDRPVRNTLPIGSGGLPRNWEVELEKPQLSDTEKRLLDYLKSSTVQPSNRELILHVLKVEKEKIGSQHYRKMGQMLRNLQRLELFTN